MLEQRIQFILEWKKRVHSVASLCRVFGISRQTGSKLIRRYLAAGRDVRALEDLSRRPWRPPHATRALVVEWVIAERKKHPHWQPRKPRVALAKRHRSRAAGGLSELSVWWVQLGIRPERIEPRKPQQNGRHERKHLTLKIETASPPAMSFQVQQRRFDRFRATFNDERPHEALDYATPSSRYTPSSQSYPCELRLPGPDPGAHRVQTNWHGVAALTPPRGLPLPRDEHAAVHPIPHVDPQLPGAGVQLQVEDVLPRARFVPEEVAGRRSRP